MFILQAKITITENCKSSYQKTAYVIPALASTSIPIYFYSKDEKQYITTTVYIVILCLICILMPLILFILNKYFNIFNFTEPAQEKISKFILLLLLTSFHTILLILMIIFDLSILGIIIQAILMIGILILWFMVYSKITISPIDVNAPKLDGKPCICPLMWVLCPLLIAGCVLCIIFNISSDWYLYIISSILFILSIIGIIMFILYFDNAPGFMIFIIILIELIWIIWLFIWNSISNNINKFKIILFSIIIAILAILLIYYIILHIKGKHIPFGIQFSRNNSDTNPTKSDGV